MRFYFRSIVDGTHWVLGQGQGLELDSFNQHCKRLTQVRGEGPGLVSGLEWSQISSVFKRLPPESSGHQASHQAEMGVMEGMILGGWSPVSLGGTHQTRRLLGGRLGAPQSGGPFPWWAAWATRHLTPDTLRLTKHPHGRPRDGGSLDRWILPPRSAPWVVKVTGFCLKPSSQPC